MPFNSSQFLLFFPVVTALYFFLPHRFRWGLLLVASCYFYMAFRPVHILILAFIILIDFCSAIWIEQASPANKKLFLIASLIASANAVAIYQIDSGIRYRVPTVKSTYDSRTMESLSH